LEEVKGVMANNIENLLARGEKLDDLMAKSEDLSGASVQFYKQGGRRTRVVSINMTAFPMRRRANRSARSVFIHIYAHYL